MRFGRPKWGKAEIGITYLLRGDGLLAGLAKLLNGLGIVAQILFAANEDDRQALAEVKNFGNPLLAEHVSASCLSRRHETGRVVGSRNADLLLNVVQ